MAEESKRWWQTIPGILTGIAGLIAAITGLIVAIPKPVPSVNVNATFVFPAPGDKIPLKTELTGTVTPAMTPEGGRYWIIIRDDDGDYYPQARVEALPTGMWTHFLTLGPAWKARPVEVSVAFAPDKQADGVLFESVVREKPSRLPHNVSVLATLDLRVSP